MKSLAVNFKDLEGGAARAAFRVHQALRTIGVDSHMLVRGKTSGDWTVETPYRKPTKLAEMLEVVRPMIGNAVSRVLKTGNVNLHSASVLPSRLPDRINRSDADVVHLHWVCRETMSVEDIGRITKPVVWTMHDMWGFCGAEHYTEDHRWRDGYTKTNRPPYEARLDLNRWVWKRKHKAWDRPMTIVTPSRWLADCVRESALMRDWTVQTIHNCIDMDAWAPVERSQARELLGLPRDAKLLLFGAMGGGRDPRKGMDLLLQAFESLHGRADGLELVVFGQAAPKDPPALAFPVHYMGHLHDDLSLRILYSAADAMLIPSRQDNLPNTGVEALACGTPVIAFATGGLPDIVTHRQTGWLARAFDPEDLAAGIEWVLSDAARHATLCANARAEALARFSYEAVAPQYRSLYERAIAGAGAAA